jgi:hypothetical protein
VICGDRRPCRSIRILELHRIAGIVPNKDTTYSRAMIPGRDCGDSFWRRINGMVLPQCSFPQPFRHGSGGSIPKSLTVGGRGTFLLARESWDGSASVNCASRKFVRGAHDVVIKPRQITNPNITIVRIIALTRLVPPLRVSLLLRRAAVKSNGTSREHYDTQKSVLRKDPRK